MFNFTSGCTAKKVVAIWSRKGPNNTECYRHAVQVLVGMGRDIYALNPYDTVEEQHLFQLPTSLVSLSIYNLTETAVQAYKTSKQGTATVSEAIKGVIDVQHEQHLELLTNCHKNWG